MHRLGLGRGTLEHRRGILVETGNEWFQGGFGFESGAQGSGTRN